jgi:hypothetical protein
MSHCVSKKKIIQLAERIEESSSFTVNRFYFIEPFVYSKPVYLRAKQTQWRHLEFVRVGDVLSRCPLADSDRYMLETLDFKMMN